MAVYRRRLVCEITKHFQSIIYLAIAISIQYEESVIGSGPGPAKSLNLSSSGDIKIHAIRRIRQVKAIAENVNNDR